MKKTILISLFALVAVGLSAQKAERKAVRSGNSAYKEQRFGAAEAEYNKAIKENANSKEGSFNLANTYYKQQKWDEALKEYEHYLKLESKDKEKMGAAWSNMGNTYLKKKANEKGQKMGQQMAQGGQAQGGQPQGGGQQADNLQQSMEAYKNALRLNPKDDETRYNLAVVQKMLKDRENEGGGGGGQDQNKDQDKKDDQNKDKQDKNQNQDKQDQKDKQDQQQQQNQMSQDNIQQMLQAIEQDEKGTQQRVKQQKVQEQKRKNEQNRKQNKDW